jgi:predicted small lipoprotein YifL
MRPFLPIVLILAAAACGQRGALYLPEEPAAEPVSDGAAEPPEAPVPAEGSAEDLPGVLEDFEEAEDDQEDEEQDDAPRQ